MNRLPHQPRRSPQDKTVAGAEALVDAHHQEKDHGLTKTLAAVLLFFCVLILFSCRASAQEDPSSPAFPLPRQPLQGNNGERGQTSLPTQPPAFGPGSPNYGKPFFGTPGEGITKPTSPASPAFRDEQLPQGIPSNAPPVRPLNSHSPMSLVFEVDRNESFGIQSTNINPIDRSATWIFNFQNAPWSTVLKNFARHSQMSLMMEQTPTGELTYFDDRPYAFSEAMDVLNDHLLQQGYLLVRNENKLTSVSATNGFRDGTAPFIAARDIPALGRNELVSVAFLLNGSVSPQAVSEVQQLLSPIGRVMPLSNSNRLIVTDIGSSLRRLRDLLSGSGIAASEVESTVFHLRNTKAQEVANVVNQRLGYGSTSTTGAIPVMQASANIGGIGGPSGFGPLANQTLSNGIGVVAETQTNSLLVEGTPEEIARISSLVREIDRDPGQVTIQALLVEVLLGNTNELGVELGFQDSVLFDRSVIDNVVTLAETSTAPNGVQTTNQRILSQTAAPGFQFNGTALGNNVTVNPSSLGKQSLTNLGVGRINGDLGFGGLVLSAGSNSVNVLLRALAEKHKLDVLSRPHVRTVNNHEALIQIGQQVPVVDGVTLSPNGTANPVVRQDKAGIILRVTPRIADNGLVQIDVQAEKSDYQLIAGSGVPIFTDASTGNVIEAPVKDITTAQTTVTAMSGQTIVLGGMITRDDSVVERKVPFLGDIPFLGRLFRLDYKQSNRKELLIFLTPTIVNTAYESDCVAAQEASRMHLTPKPHSDLHADFGRAIYQGLESSPVEAFVQPQDAP